MHSFSKHMVTAALVLASSTPLLAAQQQPKGNQSPQERALLEVARKTAVFAGNAKFCKLDSDDIEDFINKAQARLALMARDDYQKILGRLEFKNILIASGTREPEGGCDKFKIQFDTVLRENR